MVLDALWRKPNRNCWSAGERGVDVGVVWLLRLLAGPASEAIDATRDMGRRRSGLAPAGSLPLLFPKSERRVVFCSADASWRGFAVGKGRADASGAREIDSVDVVTGFSAMACLGRVAIERAPKGKLSSGFITKGRPFSSAAVRSFSAVAMGFAASSEGCDRVGGTFWLLARPSLGVSPCLNMPRRLDRCLSDGGGGLLWFAGCSTFGGAVFPLNTLSRFIE